MYLSAVPFEQIGFKTDLGATAYPEYSTGFLYSVPIVLILWPAFLMGLSYLTRPEDEEEKKEKKR
jgi:formate dehydrogenase iron-sulfur subunit